MKIFQGKPIMVSSVTEMHVSNRSLFESSMNPVSFVLHKASCVFSCQVTSLKARLFD